MKVKIDIDTRTFVRFWLVVIGFAAVIGAVYLIRGPLLLIIIALFLALALNSPVSRLAKRLPGKSRVGATAIAYLVVITILGMILFFAVPPIVEQTARFTNTVPSLIDKALSQKPALDDFVNHYNLHGALDSAVANVKDQAAQLSQQLATVLVNLVTGAVGWLLNLIIILVLTFLMLIEGPAWIKQFWDLYEDSEQRDDNRATVEKMYRVVAGFVNGQLVVAAIAAVVIFFVILTMSLFGALNVPANLAMPLAFIVLLLEVIPLVGAPIATVICGLILLLNSPLAALIFVIFYVIYQQIEGNMIVPHIQSKTVDLSALWIIIAILIGSMTFGILGALLSIPIAGCLRVLLVDYLAYARKRRERQQETKGIAKIIKRITNENA